MNEVMDGVTWFCIAMGAYCFLMAALAGVAEIVEWFTRPKPLPRPNLLADRTVYSEWRKHK